MVSLGDFPGGPGAKALTANAGGLGLILGQGTKACMPQLKIKDPEKKKKILLAATKTQCSQINKY